MVTNDDEVTRRHRGDIPDHPLPEELDWFEVDPSDSPRYFDLMLMLEDISFAADLLGAKLSWPSEEDDEEHDKQTGEEHGHLDLPKAIWNAALVAYARVFAGGVRQPIDATTIFQAGSDELEAHEYFLALRNRHVAHSVSDYELVR